MVSMAGFHGESKVAKGLVKLDAVVALARFGHLRKLTVCPIKFSRFDNRPTHRLCHGRPDIS